jgi:hypothetical protein
MAPAAGDARVEAFLADQDKALRPILEGARGLLDQGLPDARCSLKWNVPVWTGAGNIAALMPHTAHVNLQFFQGNRLPDPRRLLEGKGAAMRHLKVHTARELKDPGVKALVRAAWRLDQA